MKGKCKYAVYKTCRDCERGFTDTRWCGELMCQRCLDLCWLIDDSDMADTIFTCCDMHRPFIGTHSMAEDHESENTIHTKTDKTNDKKKNKYGITPSAPIKISQNQEEKQPKRGYTYTNVRHAVSTNPFDRSFDDDYLEYESELPQIDQISKSCPQLQQEVQPNNIAEFFRKLIFKNPEENVVNVINAVNEVNNDNNFNSNTIYNGKYNSYFLDEEIEVEPIRIKPKKSFLNLFFKTDSNAK
jgi:hypothetical protein